jgi:hypothetical protein
MGGGARVKRVGILVVTERPDGTTPDVDAVALAGESALFPEFEWRRLVVVFAVGAIAVGAATGSAPGVEPVAYVYRVRHSEAPKGDGCSGVDKKGASNVQNRSNVPFSNTV